MSQMTPQKQKSRPQTPNEKRTVMTPVVSSSGATLGLRLPGSRRVSPAVPASLASPIRSLQLKSPGTPSGTPSGKKQINDVNAIKVIARFRPENELEKSKTNNNQCIKFLDDKSLICKDETYTFDKIFNPECSQQDIFHYSVNKTVDDLFEGYNGTVLAYGQTGSGKSYTMIGSNINDNELKGLIPRITDVIFERISKADIDTEYTLSASYMEIYLEQIKDLLNTKSTNLSIQEDPINGIHVKGLSKVYVSSTKELYNVLNNGDENRTKASTDMNEESSRSHAIFQINLNQENPEFGVKRSKLFLVDLAGSEKIQKTGVTGINLEEAKKINSSLSSLGNVINALTDSKSTHIPYRHSKLTRILQESLGGNSRTSLIINCSPSNFNESETISTLRFGTRAKKIKNKAHVNNDPSKLDLITQINQLKKINEEQSLKTQEVMYELELWKTGIYKVEKEEAEEISSSPSETTLSEIEINKEAELKINGLNQRVSRLTEILTNVSNLNEHNYKNSNLQQKFIDSQKLNNELMNDIQFECMKNVDLQLKLEELKEAKAANESGKSLALEVTLEQFTIKLEELESQNHLLRQEISTIKKISETRNERIQNLESMLKSYKYNESRESINISTITPTEESFFNLRNPFHAFKKSTSHASSPSINNDDITNNDPKIYEGSSPFKIDSQYRNGNNTDDGNYKRKSQTDLGYPFSTSSHSSTDKIQMKKRSSISSNKSGESNPVNPRMGLNLHIVKPLRGGSTVILES